MSEASTSVSVERAHLGIAVIGLGVGEEHAKAYLTTGRCQLRWLYDLDAAKSLQGISRMGAGSSAAGLEDILRDPDVDVVSVASYDDAHFEQVMALLEAGKHVFVEKPLCRSLDELRAIKRTWLAHGTPHLASNLVLRTAPVYEWLRHAIEAGEFGQLYAFDGDYLYGRMQKITHGWRKDVEHYSVMQGGGVHLVDLMLWLTGQKPTTVTATGNRVCTSGTAFRYLDYVSATFQFPSGLIGRISANFGCVHRHQHVVRAFGTLGTFIADDAGPRRWTSRDPTTGATSFSLPMLPPSKGQLIPSFIEAIVSGVEPCPAAQREFDLMSVCLAADRALANAAPTTIDYV